MRKFLSLMLVIVMVVGMMPGFAVAASVAENTVGDFTIVSTEGTAELTEGADYTYTNGVLTITTLTPVTIGMKSNVTTTSETIVVDTTQGETTVSINGIAIDTEKDAAISVKGKNKATLAFINESNLSAPGNDGINIVSDTPIEFTSTENGKLSITDVKFGIFLDGYSVGGNVVISGNLQLDVLSCASHAIYCRNTGSVTISGTPVINIDTYEYAIYGYGIDITAGTLCIKSDKGYPICGAEGSDITLCENAGVHISEGKGGLRTNGGKITITDNAKYKVYLEDGESKLAVTDGFPLISTGSSGTLEISKNAVVELYSANDAISGGITSILDNAKVDIVIDTTSAYSEYALSFDDTLNISDNAVVNIDVVNGVKIHGLYDSSGVVNISDNAVVTVDGTTYKGVYVNALNLTDSASLTINHKGTSSTYYAIDGTISVKDTATLKATSGDYRVLGDPCTVTPADNKFYMVKYGKSEEDATTSYYDVETEIKDKSTWRYFHAESVENIPVTITFNTNGGSTIAAITQNSGTPVTTPANPTKEGYTFAGWDKEIPTKMPAENLTVTAQWLSADTGIAAVKVFDTAVVTLGESMTVTLLYGSTLPTANDIAVTLAQDTSTLSAITTTDGGTTWAFTVTAEDGQTSKPYTLTVMIAENPAAANIAALIGHKSVIEAND